MHSDSILVDTSVSAVVDQQSELQTGHFSQMGAATLSLCLCLWGALASAHAALGVTYRPDEAFALGVLASFSAGVPPNTTLTWRRADGRGAPVSVNVQAGATQARLLRFTPKQEYVITLSAAQYVALAPPQNVTIPATGIAAFDAAAPLVELVSAAAAEVAAVAAGEAALASSA